MRTLCCCMLLVCSMVCFIQGIDATTTSCFKEPPRGTTCQVRSLGQLTEPTETPTPAPTRGFICVDRVRRGVPGRRRPIIAKKKKNKQQLQNRAVCPDGQVPKEDTAAPTGAPTPAKCPPFYPSCTGKEGETAITKEMYEQQQQPRKRTNDDSKYVCDREYDFKYNLDVTIPVNAVNARIDFCLNETAKFWCDGCTREVLPADLFPQVKLDGSSKERNITDPYWFVKAADLINYQGDSKVRSVSAPLDVDTTGGELSCWHQRDQMAVRVCFEELTEVRRDYDYDVFGDGIIDGDLRVDANSKLTMGGTLELKKTAVTTVATSATISAKTSVKLNGRLLLDLRPEHIPPLQSGGNRRRQASSNSTTVTLITTEGTVTGSYTSVEYQQPAEYQTACESLAVETVQTSNSLAVTLSIDDSACVTGAPSSNVPTSLSPTSLAPTTVAPTSSAPTSQQPTSKAPSSAVPTSRSPTSKQPTSKSPTSKQPTSKSPTSKQPTSASPTSKSPSSAAPTSKSPSSAAPTSKAPTSKSPSSASPTSATPTSQAPTSLAPTLAANAGLPTSLSPTSQSPTSGTPTTQRPTSASPTSQSPTSASPTSQSPTSVSPTSSSPTSKSPSSASPTSSAPTSAAPTSATPTSAAPTSASPTSQAPTSRSPTSRAPTSAAPTSRAPTSLAPTSNAPTSAAPTVAASAAADRNRAIAIGSAVTGAVIAAVGIACAVAFAHNREMADIKKQINQQMESNKQHDVESRMRAMTQRRNTNANTWKVDESSSNNEHVVTL